ncbi:MgtC/SapB family protein [Limnochorda pilosa]|uniref:Magnesium transporter MgtC n=1 Tax=Limnochorda pilosa TaxID=1555112 RepID=A0A0K2SKH1_LIMPI|nr:MgtC/SapB family protein [Limnochorda pilosa]BAS27595.1 magnesium transporter MgtC [Limnochorda pilosa]
MLAEWELMVRLGLAAVLGGLVGLERESHGRPAGFRTHLLVALGSALVMLVSVYPFERFRGLGFSVDPTRIAAQVVSGIGFLGAGTILREGANVRGLTTAASLWVVAGIGLAVGSGYYLGALLTTALVVIALFWLNRLEFRFIRTDHAVVAVRILDSPGRLAAVSGVMARHGLNIRGVEIEQEDDQHARLILTVHNHGRVPRLELLEELQRLEGVERTEFRS